MTQRGRRILTTHVGSLPYPELLDQSAADDGEQLSRLVEGVVRKQREIGLDVINEGEYTKGGDWLSFVESRFSGFEERPRPPDEVPLILQGKDRAEFAAFYRYATERGSLFYTPGEQIRTRRPYWVCVGPVAYSGQSELAREIQLVKDAAGQDDVFLTTTAPASLEVYRRNEFYATEEDYLAAIGEAMRVEYQAIVQAGLILQVDDAWLPALWDRIGLQMGLEAFRKRCMIRVEVLNDALRGIPQERVRYHLCWGSWHGPHAYDLELRYITDILLHVHAGAYLIEAANARHEHEWQVWESVRLPPNKVLVPGVVTHSTDVVEHPDLVAQRLQRFAGVVGQEQLMAGADCGFGGRSHPQIAWAKLKSLVEGAASASQLLWR
jgi:5-methyltetrahydropteroyltriglutamate--homocysteine methyltransferase